MKRLSSLFTILVLLIMVLLGPALGAEEKKFVAMADQDGIQRIEMTSGSYFFNPNYVIVKANVKVELKISKESSMTPHDIEMKSPEAGMEFSEGLTSTPKIISFTPTKPGKYPFFCGKKLPFAKSHREHGMEGIIEVVP